MAVGGAAGVKGYLFQQRVSAAFLMVELLERPLSLVLGESFNFRPRSFIFEGDAEIDDFQFRTDDEFIYANIKTNLRFSLSDDGALRSAFDQFSKQHNLGHDKERFLLICDDKSSSKIRLLGELLERIRLVSFANASSTLLDDEDRNLFDAIVNLVKASLGTSADKDAFSLLQKTSIVIFSFDFSGSFVHALKVLAASCGFIRAEQLWEKLTLDCFVFAKARQVIDAEFLGRRYEEFRDEGGSSEFDFLSELILDEAHIDWVKEIVLTEWDPKLGALCATGQEADETPSAEKDREKKVAVLEMYRFDDEGSRRFEFESGNVRLANGLQLKVLGRFAAFSGLERMLDLGRIDLSNAASVQILPANVDWTEEKSKNYVQVHATRARLSFENRKPRDVCIECGKSLFAARIQLVEIDEIGRSYQCGPVHIECLTPTSRVIGDVRMPAAEEYKTLRSFDLNKWARLAKLGPAGYQALDLIAQEAALGWNWTHVIRAKGDYCTKMIGRSEAGQLEEQYVTERGNVVLRGKEDQLRNAARLKEAVERARAEGDPLMFEVGGMFGSRSQLESVDRDAGPTYEVVDLVVEKYSREKMAALSAKFQWYTPICVVRGSEGKLFEYKGAILLIRDPFKFERLAKQLARYVPESVISCVWLDIVETDHEFDALINACFNLDLGVVVDPALDVSGNFRKAVEIRPLPFGLEQLNSLIDSWKRT